MEFVLLQKCDFNTIHSWHNEKISTLFRKKFNLYPEEFNKEAFSRLMSSKRFSSIIWYDQIRIGIVSSIIHNQCMSHSIFIRPNYLNRVSILTLLNTYHCEANNYVQIDIEFKKSNINSMRHFQETEYNLNKILDTELNFNYIKSL